MLQDPGRGRRARSPPPCPPARAWSGQLLTPEGVHVRAPFPSLRPQGSLEWFHGLDGAGGIAPRGMTPLVTNTPAEQKKTDPAHKPHPNCQSLKKNSTCDFHISEQQRVNTTGS